MTKEEGLEGGITRLVEEEVRKRDTFHSKTNGAKTATTMDIYGENRALSLDAS